MFKIIEIFLNFTTSSKIFNNLGIPELSLYLKSYVKNYVKKIILKYLIVLKTVIKKVRICCKIELKLINIHQH